MEYEVRKAPLLRVGAFIMGKGDGMNLYNTSHCMDKTAAEAIQKADRSGYRDKRAMEFISMVHRLAKMAGYKIEERIVLMDMQTGKEYR